MSFVLMKVLESAPHRYDKGMKILTLGKIGKVYDALTEDIKENDTVLDIGCGTGLLTLRAALKGALVTAIDINPEMLEIAKKRINELEKDTSVRFLEMGVAELDTFEESSFDIIVSGLCFSELSTDEITYALDQISRILREDGLFLLADEIKSKFFLKRIINWFIRIPLVIISYILTQTTSRTLKNIEEQVTAAGMTIKFRKSNFLENFVSLKIINEVKK